MERKLASIQVISALTPIEGADKIETASVLGWKVVVKKGEFSVGDKCVYCEIDSILPPRQEYEFLAKSKYRIKTVRLRGQISQGICFPLTVLDIDERTPFNADGIAEVNVGDDVTEFLNVLKYEPPISGSVDKGYTRGSFPSYLHKTDETRIQSVPEVLDELRGDTFFVTVKIDGTSSTFSKYVDDIHVCSRTRSVKDGDNVYWNMFRKYNLENVFNSVPGNIAIQGEIAGYWSGNRTNAIQGNPLKLMDTQLFVFNVFNIDTDRYYDYDAFISFCERHGLQHVPIFDDNFVLDHTIDQLLEISDINYPNGGPAEGLVYRTKKERYCHALRGRASFKVINNNYLIVHHMWS